jgi:hypothetical protein
MIDKNKTCMQAMDSFIEGDPKRGKELLEVFLKEVKDSAQDHCPCPEACRYHGKCYECVTIHRGHAHHLPYCFGQMVNERLKELSQLTEHSLDTPALKKELGY